MFIALMIKEWREKALIFFFELAVLVGLLGTQFLVRQNKDLREWFVYAVLLLFFPFAALILGTAGFESEYRQGAWTYLFSRPVSRVMVWLAKFAALLGLFAILWLVFVAAWAALPVIREMAAGPRIFFEALGANSFPWWSLGLSFFMFIVAFSLAFLHERYFNLLFLSLVLGLALPALAWSLFIVGAGRFLAWMEPEMAFRTLLISLALMALAFVGASLLICLRTDFAQPRKRIGGFAAWFVSLLVFGQAIAIATALWLPLPGHRSLRQMASSGASAFFQTDRGWFVYDAAGGRVRWVVRDWPGSGYYSLNSLSGGRFAYVRYKFVARDDVRQEIWTCDSDGTGLKRVVGQDSAARWPKDPDIRDLMVSPDGRRLAIMTVDFRRFNGQKYTERDSLWTINTDGSGLEKVSADALFADGMTEEPFLRFLAWGKERDSLVIVKRYSSVPPRWSLWLYDLGSRAMTKLLDDAVPFWWRMNDSAPEDMLLIKYPVNEPGTPRTLALLDLRSLERTEIARDLKSPMYFTRSSLNGERLFVVYEKPTGGPSSYVLVVYSLAARRTIAEKVIADSEHEAYSYLTSWMPDGKSLITLDRGGRSLRILDPGLQEAGQIGLPTQIKKPGSLTVVGRHVLVLDSRYDDDDSLWRLDLDTKRWKRIY